MPSTVIETQNLTVTLPSRAGDVNILRGIDLSVAGGETVGLIGPSGSCLLYTSPSPRDGLLSRMPSSA